MENKTLTMTMLLDFYGDLLTEKQRSCFEMYYNDDLSLSEIAELQGISRQGVRDAVMRAESSLEDFEEKTGVVARYIHRKRIVAEMREQLDKLQSLARDGETELIENIKTKLSELEA